MTSGSIEQDSLKKEESDQNSQFNSKMNELKDEVGTIKIEMNDFKKEINEQLNNLKAQIEQMNDSLHQKVDSLSSWKNSVMKESMNLNQRCLTLEESQVSNNEKISVLEAFNKRVEIIFKSIINTFSNYEENIDHNKITNDQN